MAVVDNRRRDKWYHHLQKSVEGRRNDQLRELNMGRNLPGNSNHHPAVAMRFGSKPFVNPLAELMTLRQLGSVEQYQENFDSLFTRLELPVGYGINCFISGLKDEIQKGVRMFNPRTLHEAYCLAKLQEATLASIARKNATLSVIDAGKQVHSQKKNEEGPRSEVHSKVATQPEAAVNGKKNRSRFFISSAEIFARWDTGLCTWCDELYFPGHKCTKIDPDTVFEIVEEEEDLLQLDVVVENHPAKDAPQVFDESPRPNAYTKSIEGNVNGQAVAQESVETVPCEHLDGLNPSNGSLAKSTSIAHGKGTSNAQGKQVNDVEHPFVFPLGFPEPHDGWKELNCVGQGTPKPTSLAFMHAWLGEIFAASKLSVVRLVFDPGETIFTCQGKAFPDEVAFIPYTTTADLKSYSKVGFSGDDEWLWDGKNPSSIWGGKPFKALSHIGQRKFTCCFFCPVHCIEKLPLDLDGIRTSVHWKRKDNVLRTSPSRVSNGLVELEEGLLKNLEFLYNEAISELVTLGDDENVSLKVMVRNGHCGGSIWRWDCLKQILLGEEPIPCSLKIKYHVPEEEIALGPACWLWDYLRRRGAFGFLLPFSGGADSTSVVAVVGCLCQLVTKEIEQGDEQVNPDAIRIGQFADGQFPTDSKSLVFFVSWDDHSFLLRVDWDAYYIINTRGRWFFESLTLAGDDGKESFLAAFLMREMQADMMTRVMANGFCVLVFDPGSCFVIPGSPTEAWEVDSLMVFNEEKLRAEIALAGSNDFAVTVVGSEFMYEDLWVERALVLQALRPLLEKSPSENTSSSGLRIFILTGDSTSNYTKAVAYGAAVQAAVWSGRGNEKVQVDIDAFWNSREQSYTMFLLQLMASRAVADEVLYWLCGTAKESEGYIWQCAPPFKSLELKQSCEQMMKETVKSLHMGGYRAFTILSSQDVQSLLKWQPAVASIDLNEFYALNGPEVTMPRDGLQPWGIFDPGGMISLFTCLLLYTIHNLDAESAVFDPGKHGKRKVVGSVVLCESSGCASQRRGHLEVSSHLTATIFIVTSKLEDKLL